MARIDLPPDDITEYERAICYYTLSRVTHPITFGLIVAYAVCLFETVGVLAYGVVTDNATVTKAGLFLFVGVIVFGIAAFMIRAVANEVEQRKALAVAKAVPDVLGDEDEDLPDPFADNVLLRHPIHTRGDLFPCADQTGTLQYFVETDIHSHWWKVKDPHDTEVLRVQVRSMAPSFSLESMIPGSLTVHVGGEEIARVRRRFTFTAPKLEIECSQPAPKRYSVMQGNIICEKRLVGRLYYLRNAVYLDVEKAEFHDALLGLFVTIT